MWYENGTNVVRMVRKKEESVKNEITTIKKKIELFLGKNCSKIAQNFAQKVLYHNDAKKMQKMKQKDTSLIEAKRAKKEPKEEPNEKLVLSQNGAKMTQKLAQKLEINSFDFSNPRLQISTHNESIMSQNMSHKGDGSL
jgi:hypothetical protein